MALCSYGRDANLDTSISCLGRKLPLTRRFGGPSTRRFSRCHANQNLRVNLRVELVGHKTSLIVRVWLRVHTEVYTEVKQLGPGGRREFDVSIFETTFGVSAGRAAMSGFPRNQENLDLCNVHKLPQQRDGYLSGGLHRKNP